MMNWEKSEKKAFEWFKNNYDNDAVYQGHNNSTISDIYSPLYNILGFNLNDYTGVEENDYSDEIIELINLRNKARENKNWGESDRIRDVLIEKGYKVKDGKDGTILEK